MSCSLSRRRCHDRAALPFAVIVARPATRGAVRASCASRPLISGTERAWMAAFRGFPAQDHSPEDNWDEQGSELAKEVCFDGVVKMGDDADMYPRLMEAAYPADATVNGCFGFIMRCAQHSARSLTDSVIEMGVVYTYAGGESDVLQIALDTGLLEVGRYSKGREAES